MNSSAIIAAAPPLNSSVLVEKDQDVSDIIRLITYAHKKNAPRYDQFAWEFNVGDARTIARNLYNFCRENISYDIETEKKQTVRSPGRILEIGEGDCKHYASFIAGVLDSLKRCGLDIDWYYRFADYKNMWGDITHHVFVVIKEGKKEIWVDPVISAFNYRQPYWRAWDKKVNGTYRSMLGCLDMPCSCTGNGAMGADSAAEGKLLADLKSYVDGLGLAVTNLQQSGQINQAIDQVLQGAVSALVPGASQAFAIANQVATGVSNVFGAGSVLSRVVSAALTGNVLLAPINIVKTLFNGRTYNSDQYLGASDYSFYVKGIDIGTSTNVKDSDVIPALLWFETKLGVFVSGRVHVNALRQSPQAYMALYAQNSDTTQDLVRVELASQVVQHYMPTNNIKGFWAGTVGVYDNAVTAAILADRLSNPLAATDTSGTVPLSAATDQIIQAGSGVTTSAGSGISPGLLILLAGLGLIVLSSSK